MSKTQSWTVVAFRYNQHRSILYKSCKNNDIVCDTVGKAIEMDADVISIRRVYEKNPIEGQ